jgi:Arc/MetJ-type ribon-helix-helix transcriptional regulator
MNITINPEYERFIDEQVKAGRFSSPAEAMEAGIARLMLDAEPDVLDDQDVADIQHSLEQLRRGEVIDAQTVHAGIRQRITKK